MEWALRLLLAVAFALLSSTAQADPADRAALLAGLCSDSSAKISGALSAMLQEVPNEAPPERLWLQDVSEAFAARRLRCSEDAAYLAGPPSIEALTLSPAPLPDGARAPLPSLRSRAALEQLGAALALFTAPAPDHRMAAIRVLERRSDGLPPGLVSAALEGEQDKQVAAGLKALLVAAGLHAADTGQRLAAIAALGSEPSARTVTTLASLQSDASYTADPRVRDALAAALARVHRWVVAGNALALLYNGLSAGSVLFLASAGLAIIFGLMGVINLAQGELIMIGAYVTFGVQEGLRQWAPGWLDWYPLVALPVVFLVTGLVGVVMEIAVIRHLYRRPLMTLLATWAISLLLINIVRAGFGTQNLQFATPPYLTGGVHVLGDFLVTWNHLAAIACAVAAFAATLGLLRLTDLGLFIRAVTQNRNMAASIGISTRKVDAAAFGLGSGLAGVAGLALSPIYNVNPTMGTGFIIDSFMVVVLGGVGSLFGTALASVGIGLVNVGIEPFYGAVAAKVIVLLMIVLLIQWRPEGLVAARGRR